MPDVLHVVENTTDKELTQPELNDLYSSAGPGPLVICKNIPLIYLKTSSEWLSLPVGSVKEF